MEEQIPKAFLMGMYVDIIFGDNKVIGTGKVLNKKYPEIIDGKRYELEIQIGDGEPYVFTYYPEYGGWKIIFEGLAGELCINPRGPVYQFRTSSHNSVSLTLGI